MDTERLSSLDELGNKKILIPADVRGRFRRRRTHVQAGLLLFFLILPWFRINGHQALLIDIAHREFSFLGLKLFAHDTPMLFLVLATCTFGLVFMTSVWGRVWCGWACPQTVFIEGVYRRIENVIEGSYLERRRALVEAMTVARWFRKILKWAIFAIISSIIAHSFVAIFVGSHQLLAMMGTDPQANWSYFVLISAMTGLMLFNFGWFREQFCVIMCPYGRFQSVLMDSTSMAIVYNETRGEPRKGRAGHGAKVGDCVACRRCVEVCPTGIDIRHGLQMDCIACTNCIDACDEIMDKLKKPRGLIRYGNLRGGTWQFKKGRAFFSLGMMLLCFTLLILFLARRAPIDVTLLRGTQPLFIDISEANQPSRFANPFHLHIRNQTYHELTVHLNTDHSDLVIASQANPFKIEGNEDRQIPFFIQFPAASLDISGERVAELKIQVEDTDVSVVRTLHLQGPGRK